MSFTTFQTPARPLPGAFLQTPAASRFQGQGQGVNRQLFTGRAQSMSGAQVASTNEPPSSAQPTGVLVSAAAPQQMATDPVQRAARTINEMLRRDANFPELDSYVKQGISSDYDIPSQEGVASAWSPYQKSKMYDIPETIMDQYNHTTLMTMMGLFAELNYAWITIDNALYLWDFTQTNPVIEGFEEQSNGITAVKLLKPKKGVFVDKVTHLLVVATTAEIFLLGVNASINPATGSTVMQLFNTGMSLNIKGIDVRVIEGSAATGRIFFGGGSDNEVYELTYQQEEKWFASKCGKVNHTSPGYTSLIPLWNKKSQEHVIEIAVDDSRGLLYTLSSQSCIRIFHMDTPHTLKLMVEKGRHEFLRDISHMISQSPLLEALDIVSISAISAYEAAKLHLMATTSTGCRLYLSATRGYGYLAGKGDAPTSMQVQHIKFPPPERGEQQPPRSPAQAGYQPFEQIISTTSKSLIGTNQGARYPPGYFMCFSTKENAPNSTVAFLSAPDTGRIASEARDLSGQSSKYYEYGMWLHLDSQVEAVGLITKKFVAANSPVGFGNELAVQFDEAAAEVAILTNTGITTVRRRRLVDVFAAALRLGASAGETVLEREINQFIRQYGRSEATAAALAVACGQGADVSSGDMRTAKVFDAPTLETARKTFIDYGGRATFNIDAMADNDSPINHVRPSARHEGMALYIARIIRSLWRAPVMQETIANGFVKPVSTISAKKLRSIQDDISMLNGFLERNKSFIQGLSRPDGVSRGAGQHEEIALQGEHQALHSLQELTARITEGISFVTMLFEERMEEVWNYLDDSTRQQFRELTYEGLFTSDEGKNLGKILVKVIVNINISNGANVETVADALRLKCGSFCSPDDVLIFKAQEQLKKASEQGPDSDAGRYMLNQSLSLFKRVAGSLTAENLQNAVEQYVEMRFYAGAIQLCLIVAMESDRGNAALSWLNDGKPGGDPRVRLYQDRKRCYELVHRIIETVDEVAAGQPVVNIDGKRTLMAQKRDEAYDMLDESQDEVFHYDLYDWYLSQGWVDRLLNSNSEFVEKYLEQQSKSNIQSADLLCRYYASKRKYYQAGQVQAILASSSFDLPLKARVEYLSQAKANASTTTIGVSRALQQQLLRDVSAQLEIANIQDEILSRLRNHELISEEKRQEIVEELDGPNLDISTLFNNYADKANLFDVSLLIFQAAGHQNPADIESTWNNLIKHTHTEVENRAAQGIRGPQPYEAVITIVREMAYKLQRSEITFSPEMLIPMLEEYALEFQKDVGPPTWVMDLFIDVGIGYERILRELERMIHNPVAPFDGRNSKYIKRDALYVVAKWFDDCKRHNTEILGGGETIYWVVDLLAYLTNSGGLDQILANDARELRAKVEKALRR